jgi:uncharacterized membrane protein YbhN (UPF0104 family)
VIRWIERLEERPLTLSLVAAMVTVGVSVGMASAAGWDAIFDFFGRIQVWWIWVIFVGRFAAYVGYSAAHRRMVLGAGGEELPLGTIFRLAAFGHGPTSLRSGFSVDRRALLGAGVSYRDASVSVLGLGALEYAVLAPPAWVCALLLLQTSRVQGAVTVPWSIGVPVGTLLALAAMRWHRSRSRTSRRRPGLVSRALDALQVLRSQVVHPVENAAAWLGMALHWAGEIASLWASLRLFGLHPRLSATILGYATGYVLSPRSMPLAGVGITEALLPISLMWVGLPLAGAVLAVALFQLVRLAVSTPAAELARAQVLDLLAAYDERRARATAGDGTKLSRARRAARRRATARTPSDGS